MEVRVGIWKYTGESHNLVTFYLHCGLREVIRKVYEVGPMICPQCGRTMKVVAFLTDHAMVDRIISHLKLTFVAERPPPPQFA